MIRKTERGLVNACTTVKTFKHVQVTQELLMQMFTNPKYQWDKQRHHEANAVRKKYLHTTLTGMCTNFTAVYIKESKSFKFLDGYTRAEVILNGKAQFEEGVPIYVLVQCVESYDDAVHQYNQIDNAAASKKAVCGYQSGLRSTGLLHTLKSDFVLKAYGMASAVQYATGYGLRQTLEATIMLEPALRFVDGLNLRYQQHEIAGVKAVYLAAAQLCSNKEVVESFIRKVNSFSYSPIKPTTLDRVVMKYRKSISESHTTGGGANLRVFLNGLFSFIQYLKLAIQIKPANSVFTTKQIGSITQFKAELELIRQAEQACA